MKHKIGMIIACSALVVFVVVAKIYLIHNYFWKGFDYLFQKEEQARIEALERGDFYPGRDTVLIWKKSFLFFMVQMETIQQQRIPKTNILRIVCCKA